MPVVPATAGRLQGCRTSTVPALRAVSGVAAATARAAAANICFMGASLRNDDGRHRAPPPAPAAGSGCDTRSCGPAVRRLLCPLPVRGLGSASRFAGPVLRVGIERLAPIRPLHAALGARDQAPIAEGLRSPG